MNKIILLGFANDRSLNNSKTGFKIAGFLFLMNAVIFLFFASGSNTIRILAGLLFIFGSLLFLFQAYFGFSEKSKFAPKIEVNRNSISIKKNMFSKPEVFSWEKIKSISLGSFVLFFEVDDGTESIHFNTSPENSIEIKKAIREIAEIKKITVSNL